MGKFYDIEIGPEIKKLEKQIQELYLSDDLPWIVGYSGGKDSQQPSAYLECNFKAQKRTASQSHLRNFH